MQVRATADAKRLLRSRRLFRRRQTTATERSQATGILVDMEENSRKDTSQLLVSRRAFLYGTAVAGAAATLGLGLSGCGPLGGSDGEVPYLKVPESSLVTLNDFEALESAEGHVQLIGNFELPYGTLVWETDDNVAACLLPTASGTPLAQVALLFLGSGNLETILERAVGAAEHFEIYDVRATSNGVIWTEANILQGLWRVYTAKLHNGGIDGQPQLVDEGDATYDTPTLGAADNRAFWQVVPKSPNDSKLPSLLMGATFGRNDAERVFENARTMGTPPYSASDSITIAPRLDQATTYYQLTNLNSKSGSTEDTMTLPGGMAPLEAGYGQTGFMFSFADIYNYGEGISNLGTYVPLRKPSDGDYSSVKWFGFARTPTAAPAWCNGLLIVKSSYSVCGVDLDEGTYFALDVDNGADDYGDYLASSGTHGNFVTYSNIDHQPIGAPAIHCCRVKVWTTVS